MTITSTPILNRTKRAYKRQVIHLERKIRKLKKALCPVDPEIELVTLIAQNTAELIECKTMIENIDFELSKN